MGLFSKIFGGDNDDYKGDLRRKNTNITRNKDGT